MIPIQLSKISSFEMSAVTLDQGSRSHGTHQALMGAELGKTIRANLTNLASPA
ncbi:hypothetical protein [Streptomyces sp. NPDC057107]|uniref:hypothetical protein n=1 Tax=Streptomyces sp. NPDC057107 TaxID=3346021 RepID=UPI00362A2AE3